MYVIAEVMSKLTIGCGAAFLMVAAYVGTMIYRPIPERYCTVPPGRYVTGSPETGTRIIETRGYRVQATEVTVGQYLYYLRAARPEPPYASPQIEWTGRRYRRRVSARDPVAYVDVEQARAYTDWLSIRRGKTIRLPTPDEWEIAASGGGRGLRYPWGWNEPANRAQWNAEAPTRVGSFEPNALGLYDMAGNVAEWGLSPHGRPVALGGSWADRQPDALRVAHRIPFDAGYRDADVGFRVVIE